MKLHGDSFTQGFKKSNITARNQTFGDFKSNPALGGKKPKELTTISSFLRKDIALVWFPGKQTTTTTKNASTAKGDILQMVPSQHTRREETFVMRVKNLLGNLG